MEDQLFYPLDLPSLAKFSEWRLVEDPILDNVGSLTAKMGANRKGNGRHVRTPKPGTPEEAALRYDAILKYGWPGTSIKEWVCSRLIRLCNLPAAPVQILNLQRRPGLGVPFGALIHVIPSVNAPELWNLSSNDLCARGINPEIVAKLKAFVIWISGMPGNEIGEFRLSLDGCPFMIDHQDVLFLDSFGNLKDYPKTIPTNYWRSFFPDPEQIEIAKTFWTCLPGIVYRFGQLDPLGAKLFENFQPHLMRFLTSREIEDDNNA